VRFTSHRDVARMWERAFRKAGVAVALTEGFSPRPRVSFGLALPTGAESLAEYLDAELTEGRADPADLVDPLTAALPSGLAAVAAKEVEAGAPSLQADVASCTWRIAVAGVERQEAIEAIGAALASPELRVTRSRKGVEQVDDVRPSIASLTVGDGCVDNRYVEDVEGDDGSWDRSVRDAYPVVLAAELWTQPRGLRPDELLAAVLPSAGERRVLRTRQTIERDGARWEPLPPAATPRTAREVVL
jgi:radical SAM-linked protein